MDTVAELRKALELAPGDRELRRDLCRALGAAGYYEESYQVAVDLLRADQDSAEVIALAGNALLSDRKPEEAIPLLQKSFVADPRNLQVRASLAQAYMQTAAPKLALPHLQAAAASDRDGTLHHLLASAYRQTGQPELARQALQRYESLAAASAQQPVPPAITPPD